MTIETWAGALFLVLVGLAFILSGSAKRIGWWSLVPLLVLPLVGCTAHQMRPLRDAAILTQDVATVAEQSAETMQLAADVAETVEACREQIEQAPPPELLGVHPCVWDVMADAQRLAVAVSELAAAIEDATAQLRTGP